MQELKFENYNKIEDIIYYLGPNAAIKMNVSLYQNSEKYGRRSYHQELQYYNEKSNQKVVNMKRSFDYYASIENLKAVDHIKEYIIIRQQDIYMLRKVANTVFKTIFTDEFDNLFGKKGGVLTLRNKIKPIEFSGLSLRKYLVFAPDICEKFNGEKEPGIRVNLSSPTNCIVMNESKFAGLLECLNNMDMFNYAQTMLNYLGKPDFGTNMYDFTSTQGIEDNVVARSGRKVSAKSNKSYFSKMSDLEKEV